MKKKEVRAVLEALKKVKVMKIEPEEFRAQIISIHLALLGVKRKIDEDVEDLKAAILGPYTEDAKRVVELNREMMAEQDDAKKLAIAEKINSFKGYLDASDAFSDAMGRLGEEEVTGLNPVSAEQFCREYQKQDYDFDVVEKLYPLFG